MRAARGGRRPAVRRRRSTRQECPPEVEDPPIVTMIIGVALIIFGIYMYVDIGAWERSGRSDYETNDFVVLAYNVAGKEGVLLMGVLCGVGCLGMGASQMHAEKQPARRRQRRSRSGKREKLQSAIRVERETLADPDKWSSTVDNWYR